MCIETHWLDVENDIDTRPATVDHKNSTQPHKDDEHHEVTMIIVTYTVEHPRWAWVKEENKLSVILQQDT